MNTLLTTTSRHESAQTERLAQGEPSPQRARRVGLVDRAALHLGVALIKWGRRPGATERRVTRAELSLLHRDRQYALASLANEELPVDYVTRFLPLR